MADQPSLGLVAMPERTIEHDFLVLARYVDFSTELLRLSLLGLSAIAFGISKVLFPEVVANTLKLDKFCTLLVVASLAAFAVSAAGALLHRYSSTDSIAWHLQSMRRYQRANDNAECPDWTTATEESRKRHAQFRRARTSLAVSATALGLGAISLAVAATVHLL